MTKKKSLEEKNLTNNKDVNKVSLFNHKSSNFTTRRKYVRQVQDMTMISMFSAIAYILHFFQVGGIGGFLTYEPKNVVVCLSGVVLGPIKGIIVCFIVAFLELITTSDTGLYGFLMNFIAGVFFSLPIILIYRRKRNMFTLILSSLIGSLSLMVVMVLLNLAITPLFLSSSYGGTYNEQLDATIKLIPVLILPFNFIKGLLDSSFIIMFFRIIMRHIEKLGYFNLITTNNKTDKRKDTLYTIVTALVCLLVCAGLLALIFYLYK